jgi:hypothetical protein
MAIVEQWLDLSLDAPNSDDKKRAALVNEPRSLLGCGNECGFRERSGGCEE